MTDTWLNQGGDASMATVASREIRSRGKEQGQLQVSEIKDSERNLLIGTFLHSTPNSITISFRQLTCHGEEGPLEY